MKTQLKLSSILSDHKRGSALLMALVITIVLFILGITFVSTTTTEKSMVSNPDFDIYLNDGIEDVLFRITNRISSDGEWRYDYTDGAHPWLASLEPQVFTDLTGDELYCWPQITDLWGQFNRNINNPRFDPDLRGNPLNTQYGQYDNLGDDSRFLVTRVNSVINVVANDKPILNTLFYKTTDKIDPLKDSIEGMGADADGDGLTDSRWRMLDGRRGPNGEYLFAAARVIDNGGMININTAYRRPPAPAMGYWDGTRLGHISLQGVTDPLFLHEKFRCEKITTAFTDAEYELNVAQRFMNPSMPGTGGYYLPFGFADEMELRNRLLLTTPSRARLEYALSNGMPEPVNPKNAIPGFDDKKSPYLPVGDGSQLDNTWNIREWFDYLTNDLDQGRWLQKYNGIYNPRHLLTTYSFDSTKRPSSKVKDSDIKDMGMLDSPGLRKFGVVLPTEFREGAICSDWDNLTEIKDKVELKEEYLKQLAASLFRALYSTHKQVDFMTERFGPYQKDKNGDTEEEDFVRKLCFMYALNFADHQDADIDTTGPTTHVSTLRTKVEKDEVEVFYGFENEDELERVTLCISKIGFVEIDNKHSANNFPTGPITIPVGKYYAIELFNPDGNADDDKLRRKKENLDLNYILCITDDNDEPKAYIELKDAANFANKPVIYDSNKPSTTENNTIVLAFSSVAATVANIQSAFNMTVTPTLVAPNIVNGNPKFTFSKSDKLILLRKNYPYDEKEVKKQYPKITVPTNAHISSMPVDCVEYPFGAANSGVPALTSADVNKGAFVTRKETMPNSNILVPVDTDTSKDLNNLITDWTVAKPASAANAGTFIDVTNLKIYADDSDDTTNTFDNLSFDAANRLLKNPGEIADIPVFGSYYYYNEKNKKLYCQTFAQGVVNSYATIKDKNPSDISMLTANRLDIAHPDYRGLMDYFTYFDPSNDVDLLNNPIDNNGINGANELTETQIAGRININTAPWYVIAQLPWLQNNTATTLQQKMRLARAIVAYRDKKALVIRSGYEILTDHLQNGDNIIVSYCEDFANNTNVANAWKKWSGGDITKVEINKRQARKFGMGLKFKDVDAPDVREDAGFSNIAELLNVTHHVDNKEGLSPLIAYNAYADIRQWAKNINTDKTAINDNVKSNYISPFCDKIDDPAKPVGNNYVERDILFNRISNLVTTRSDVFTAYIVVRLGWNGPQKRIIATIDRSSGTPKIVSEYQVPDPL